MANTGSSRLVTEHRLTVLEMRTDRLERRTRMLARFRRETDATLSRLKQRLQQLLISAAGLGLGTTIASHEDGLATAIVTLVKLLALV